MSEEEDSEILKRADAIQKKREAAKLQQETKKLVKLDVGCGKNKKEGFIGIDKIKLDGVDIVHDLDAYPYPFDDNSVDEIHASHIIEHLKDLCAFMDEMYRIMKPDTKLTVIAPYYSSMRAWQDPTHKRAISEVTFMYFNKGWRDINKLDHYGIKCNFEFTYGYAVTQAWATRSEEARNFAIRHYINVIDDIHVVLVKK